jgi:glutamate racemase
MSGYLGIVDWGVGGVGVMRALRRRAQSLPVLYFSDAGFTPYGLLSRTALAARLSLVVNYLQRQGASAVVLACNAASTVIDRVHAPKGCPLRGVIEPALRLVPRDALGTVAVIGGRRTIRSGVYRRGLSGLRVKQRIAQPLSAYVEAGTSDSDACSAVLDRVLLPLRGAELLLLACTHYPALAAQIQARLPETKLLDPAEALAAAVLSSFEIPSEALADRTLTTGDPEAMQRAAWRAWQVELPHVEAISLCRANARATRCGRARKQRTLAPLEKVALANRRK